MKKEREDNPCIQNEYRDGEVLSLESIFGKFIAMVNVDIPGYILCHAAVDKKNSSFLLEYAFGKGYLIHVKQASVLERKFFFKVMREKGFLFDGTAFIPNQSLVQA